MPTLVERLASSLSGLHRSGVTERTLYAEILRQTLAANDDYYCVWTVWEPDALDARDAEHRDKPHHDATGRFVTSWHRAGRQITRHSVEDYDRPGRDDWYHVPRKTGELCVMEAGVVRIGGQDVRVSREIAPILLAGRVLGVVGTDRLAPPANPPVPLRRAPLSVRPIAATNGSAGLQRLTRREREVHYWICQGKSNDDISRILEVSPHTIKNHVDHIFQKLGVENRYAAALLHPSRAAA